MDNVVTLQDLAVYMEQNVQHCFSVASVAQWNFEAERRTTWRGVEHEAEREISIGSESQGTHVASAALR